MDIVCAAASFKGKEVLGLLQLCIYIYVLYASAQPAHCGIATILSANACMCLYVWTFDGEDEQRLFIDAVHAHKPHVRTHARQGLKKAVQSA
jgi:hypothetical protein